MVWFVSTSEFGTMLMIDEYDVEEALADDT
jgi:hypothetical protein